MRITLTVLVLALLPMTWGCATSGTVRSRLLWEIGVENKGCNEFDTEVHDDPEIIEFEPGTPVKKFPAGLGTELGNQRSVINIYFSGAAPHGCELRIVWSAGGSAAEEQFRVDLNGRMLGLSAARTGTLPYTWLPDTFQLPKLITSGHTITLTHLKGDGLEIDYIALSSLRPADKPTE